MSQTDSASDHSDLILALDVGSSSLRAQIYLGTGQSIPGWESQQEYDTRTTDDGGSEIDPAQLFTRLCKAIDLALDRVGSHAARIRGVGMCAQVMNVLGVDAEGQPTTPIYTWSDLRGAREAYELQQSLSDAEAREQTGCVIHTSYLLARLSWLRRSHPEAYARTMLWLSLGDWVYLQLFGRAAQSLSVASWGGLLNRHTLSWDSSHLSLLHLDGGKLPTLVDADQSFQDLRPPFDERWPRLREVPWFPCVGDGAGGNVGSGCVTPDAIAVQVGTSGAMRAMLPGTPPQVPDGLFCYRLDRHHALLGGSFSEGGNVFKWLKGILGVQDLKEAQREAKRMEPDSHGLTVLPFLAGERSPGWHLGARGVIAGLSLSTGPAHILRAAQEAITYRFKFVYDALTPVLPPTQKIVASGGALLGAEGWPAMLADVLGRPVTAMCDMQASSRGVALLVSRSLGLISSLDQAAIPLAETYKPDMAQHRRYMEALQRQHQLYSALIEGEITR